MVSSYPPMLMIEVEKIFDENAENEHLDEVLVMCLFSGILINTWLLVCVRIRIFSFYNLVTIIANQFKIFC